MSVRMKEDRVAESNDMVDEMKDEDTLLNESMDDESVEIEDATSLEGAEAGAADSAAGAFRSISRVSFTSLISGL